MSKYFFITIDTEGDNQWDNNKDSTTENVKYLPRFQELAEKYNFKPVWLSNYEMISDNDFVNYFKPKQDLGLCEIGMHLHAWSNPPFYKLKKVTANRSYITEYPKKIIDEKVKILTNLIELRFGTRPISHRSGRWALNDDYLNVLEKYGYKIDCSVTPNIDWSNNLGQTGLKGNNYKNYPNKEYFITDKIYEIPVTVKKIHVFSWNRVHSLKKLLREAKHFILGSLEWVRPNKFDNYPEMLKIVKKCNKNNQYIMFMIHSSELMPGGSPNFKDDKSIDKMYENIEKIFKFIKSMGYIGITLKEYYKEVNIDE